jgi:5-formyltetrahydrofolate cyclo-ligase
VPAAEPSAADTGGFISRPSKGGRRSSGSAWRMTDVRPLKRRLRRETVERILALDPADRAAQQAALAERFPGLPGLSAAGTVLLYASAFPEEIDTRAWLAWALARGRRLVSPRVDRGERRLRLFEVKDLKVDLVPGTLGIPEPRADAPEVAPVEVDWVLVPGLAFDGRAYRLGRGAGHYDRLLPTLRPDAPRWALCLDCQWVDGLPVEAHDVPLDGVVSPSRAVVRTAPVTRP